MELVVLAAALLRRTEGVLQPVLQCFLTSLLTGARSDSELRQDYHELIHVVRRRARGQVAQPCCGQGQHQQAKKRREQVHPPLPLPAPLRACPQLYEIVPQVLLPVLPHLKSELEVEDDAKRATAVDLVARLFLHVRARRRLRRGGAQMCGARGRGLAAWAAHAAPPPSCRSLEAQS